MAGLGDAHLVEAYRLSEEANAHFKAGTCDRLALAAQQYERATSLFAQSDKRKYRREAATTAFNAGQAYQLLGSPDSALPSYRRALQLWKALQVTDHQFEVLNNIAEVHHGAGRLDSSRYYYRRALDAASAAGSGANKGLIWNNTGLAYQALGRPDSAFYFLRRSAQYRRDKRDTLGLSVTLNNEARVFHTLGRLDSALYYLEASLRLKQSVRNPAGEGRVLNNIGYTYDLMGQPDSALVFYRKAFSHYAQGCSRTDRGMTLTNMGRAFLAQNEPDSALADLRRGLALEREVDDLDGQAWALDDIGSVYLAHSRMDSARAYFSKALSALRRIDNPAREGLVLYHMAQTYDQPHRPADLPAAIAYYDSAAAVRATVRFHAGSDANQLSYAEQDVALFADWVLACLSQPSNSEQPQRAAYMALAAAERGRAQALLDLIQTTTPQHQDVGDLVTSRRPAVGDLYVDGRQLAEASTQSGAAVLTYLVTNEVLVTWLALPSGTLHISRSDISRDSLSTLVELLRGGYGMDGASDRQTSTHDAGETSDRRVPQLERNIRPQRGNVTTSQAEQAAYALSDAVLSPSIQNHLPESGELIIVPHGSLNLLPFSVLPLGSSKDTLGIHYAVRYVPSLSTLIEIEQSNALSPAHPSGESSTALIVGNPRMPEVLGADGRPYQLTSLAGAEREARQVATLLGVHAPIIGERATETHAKQQMPQASLIHFATHGFAFSSDALVRSSFVALAPDKQNDGLLTIDEVLGQLPPLAAELVVLSACQTGLGNLKQAEGTVGLQRAFLAQGARSVLVSLWSVSDAATELLMKRFYTHWIKDTDRPNKAEALQRAQTDVRQTAGFAHPRYWAAFQLVGAQ